MTRITIPTENNFDPEQIITLAESMLAKGKALPFPDPLDADVVADYLRARGELPRPLAPRIRFLR